MVRQTVWTKETIAKLKSLWLTDKNCTDIAKLLGSSITKHAVIGKAHRLKLPPKKTSSLVKPPVQKKKDLCQWPIGFPGEKTFRFCSLETLKDKPYCQKHCDMAYKK